MAFNYIFADNVEIRTVTQHHCPPYKAICTFCCRSDGICNGIIRLASKCQIGSRLMRLAKMPIFLDLVYSSKCSPWVGVLWHATRKVKRSTRGNNVQREADSSLLVDQCWMVSTEIFYLRKNQQDKCCCSQPYPKKWKINYQPSKGVMWWF